MASAALVADLETELSAVRAEIARATGDLVAALRVFPNCHNFRVSDLNPLWWTLKARDRERASVGTEAVAKARVRLEALLAAEGGLLAELTSARHAAPGG